jgi:hypothetical protein
MNKHPYVRAYMAGAIVPTIFMLIVIALFFSVRYVYAVPLPVERVIIFPMAFVPNLIGLWNVFYMWLQPRVHLPIGCHGALLPILLIPLGAIGAVQLSFLEVGAKGNRWYQLPLVPWGFVAPALSCVLIVYYLVWRYLVAFFNRIVEIA